jgi:hypothetical protein
MGMKINRCYKTALVRYQNRDSRDRIINQLRRNDA